MSAIPVAERRLLTPTFDVESLYAATRTAIAQMCDATHHILFPLDGAVEAMLPADGSSAPIEIDAFAGYALGAAPAPFPAANYYQGIIVPPSNQTRFDYVGSCARALVRSGIVDVPVLPYVERLEDSGTQVATGVVSCAHPRQADSRFDALLVPDCYVSTDLLNTEFSREFAVKTAAALFLRLAEAELHE
jgi:hypothetical protein